MGYNSDQPLVKSNERLMQTDPKNLDYKLTASFEKSSNKTLMFKIVLERKSLRCIIEKVIPCGLLVMVSWVSLKSVSLNLPAGFYLPASGQPSG